MKCQPYLNIPLRGFLIFSGTGADAKSKSTPSQGVTVVFVFGRTQAPIHTFRSKKFCFFRDGVIEFLLETDRRGVRRQQH